MIVGIDGNEANVEKRLGVGEITYQLLLQFSNEKRKTKNVKYVIYLKSNPVAGMPEQEEGWTYRVLKPGKLWTQWRLPLDLYMHNPRPDVFFTPTHYAPRFCPVPSVISIMDLAYVYFPELFKTRDLYKLDNWTKYSVRNATKIIAISSSTKNDIIKEYKVEPDKVEVVYPGIKLKNMKSPQDKSKEQLFDKYNVSRNFILFVGTLQPRKNITGLMEAFNKVIKSSSQQVIKSPRSSLRPRSGLTSSGQEVKSQNMENLELVIIGKKGWMYEEILNKPKELGIENSVKFLDFVPDEELGFFYENAICYVLPSLYEGFGLPVLEAMGYGCPVITSNISSLPEAGGDAALYADPKSPEEIAEKIMLLMENKELRQELIDRGFKQVKKFSWEKAARETLEALEEVAKSK